MVDAKSNAGVKVVDFSKTIVNMARSLPKIASSRCVLQLSDTSRLPSALLEKPRQPAPQLR